MHSGFASSWAKQPPVTHETCRNDLLNVASTDFTLSQEVVEEVEEELGFNMTAPVGAPSYITSYFLSLFH